MRFFSDSCPVPDAGGVYRLLFEMENQGLVDMTWGVESAGLAKRIYFLIPQGVECLTFEDQTLEQYQGRIRSIRDLMHSYRQKSGLMFRELTKMGKEL